MSNLCHCDSPIFDVINSLWRRQYADDVISTMARKMQILLVEDDLGSHVALVRLLKNVGYEVFGATTLREAMTQIHSPPDCAILDLMLPDGNGITALKEIRERKLATQVAVTTAVADPGTICEVLRLRPNKLFHKPVDVPRLLEWLRGCEEELGEKNPKQPASGQAKSSGDKT